MLPNMFFLYIITPLEVEVPHIELKNKKHLRNRNMCLIKHLTNYATNFPCHGNMTIRYKVTSYVIRSRSFALGSKMC